MGSQNVLMETHVVSSLLEYGAAVHFHEQSVAMMEYIAALMDTPAMLDVVVEKAKSCLCQRSYQLQREILR